MSVEAQRVAAERPGVRRRLAARLAEAWAERRVRWLSLLFCIGQLGDAVTTNVALRSGRFSEANPLFSPALVGTPGLAYALKGLLALGVLVGALTLISRPRRWVVLALLAAISVEAPLTNLLRILGLI